MTSSQHPFTYSPLTAPDSIRLLHILPSPDPNAPINCTLHHTTLRACSLDIITPFTALSYVWGSPAPTPSSPIIHLNTYPFPVTQSLHAALRDLRDSTRELRLWADAVCIDQSNAVERGKQVSLMGEIYSTAQHTVIHLFPSNEEYTRILGVLPSNTSSSIDTSLDRGELVELAEKSLLSAVWFSRVWVFQELVLSKDPWVQSGNIRARWTDLCSHLLSPGITQPTPQLQILSSMNLARGPHSQPLVHYLSTRRGLGATNPVDMIYSHLGLISDLSLLQQYVPISYEIETREVYEDVARYVLETMIPSKVDGFFELAEGGSGMEVGKRVEGLASWAPDWSMKGNGLVSMYRDDILSMLRLVPKDHFAFTESNPRVLGWIGYQVTEIGEVGCVFPGAGELRRQMEGGLESYDAVAEELRAVYQKAGVWWSGDEWGRYRHVNLSGKEEENERLSKAVAEEWMSILESLPSISTTSSPSSNETNDNDINAHSLFIADFKTWLDEKIAKNAIMVGNNSEGLLNLMWIYLLHNLNTPSVLASRRLCTVTLIPSNTKQIAVIPAQAQKGDQIIYLAGMEVALVVRPDEGVMGLRNGVEEEVREVLLRKETDERREVLGRGVQEMRVRVVRVVGEAYVDGVIGWGKRDKAEGVRWDGVVFGMR